MLLSNRLHVTKLASLFGRARGVASTTIERQLPPFRTSSFGASHDVVYRHQQQKRFMASSGPSKYHCVHVLVKTKPGTEEAFQEASLKNARNSAKETGVVRFDVLQSQDNPCHFLLVEVYTDAVTAPAAHKETSHYLEWRDTVADMMAEPRQASKFTNLFPTTADAWSYPRSEELEG